MTFNPNPQHLKHYFQQQLIPAIHPDNVSVQDRADSSPLRTSSCSDRSLGFLFVSDFCSVLWVRLNSALNQIWLGWWLNPSMPNSYTGVPALLVNMFTRLSLWNSFFFSALASHGTFVFWELQAAHMVSSLELFPCKQFGFNELIHLQCLARCHGAHQTNHNEQKNQKKIKNKNVQHLNVYE